MMLRSKTFLRYMLSYALVLFLPMLVLCMVFYFAALDRFTEEVTLSNSRALEQVQEGFDAQLEQIVHLSYLIQNNASLHPAAIGSDIMAARSAVNTLSTYKSITTLPELIMVYAENSDMLYTNAGVLSLEDSSPSNMYTALIPGRTLRMLCPAKTASLPGEAIWWSSMAGRRASTSHCL